MPCSAWHNLGFNKAQVNYKLSPLCMQDGVGLGAIWAVQGGIAAQYMNTIQYLELLSSTPAHSTFTLRFTLLLCKYNCVTVKYAAVKLLLWGGSKGLINFPWIFDAMRSLVPVGHFGNISRHLFTWLVCRSFQ